MRLRAGLARPGHGAELPAGGDAELDEDLPEVPFDGVRADKQLGSDLLIRQTVAGQSRDLRLLGRQLVARAERLFAYLLTGRNQLSASPLGEGLRAHSGEHLMGGAELLAGCGSSVRSAQPFAVTQPGPREMHDDAGALQAFNGFSEMAVGVLVVSQ